METSCYEQHRMCVLCGESLPEYQFYRYKDNTPDCICKGCMLKDEDDFDEYTYVSILKRYDMPYIPDEWNALRDRQIRATVKRQCEYIPIVGKYLSKMKLKSFAGYGFADSMKLMNLYGTNEYKRMTFEEAQDV